jgi:hypothetical protein
MSTQILPSPLDDDASQIAQIDQCAREIQAGLNILVHALDALSQVGDDGSWNWPTEPGARKRVAAIYDAIELPFIPVPTNSGQPLRLYDFTGQMDAMESLVAHVLGEPSRTVGPDSGLSLISHD